jgi:hypothetical protein
MKFEESRERIPDATELLEKQSNKFVYSPSITEAAQSRVETDARETVEISVEPEPSPVKNDLPYLWPKAIERIIQAAKQRDEFGEKKYGTRLQPFNGRDPLVDMFQEVLDALVYLEQEFFERPYKEAVIQAALKIVDNGVNHLDHEQHITQLFNACSELKQVQS